VEGGGSGIGDGLIPPERLFLLLHLHFSSSSYYYFFHSLPIKTLQTYARYSSPSVMMSLISSRE